MTTVVISQPMYFPWAGFFGQMAQADVYVWLDDVQFSKGSFTNRVQVRTASGQGWMSIPLAGKGAFQTIAALTAADDKWRQGHRDLLRQQLKGAPYLPLALGVYDEALENGALLDVLIASAEAPARAMNVLPSSIIRSSRLGVSASSSHRVLELVQAVGGTRYLTGHGAANYLDHSLFEQHGIAVEYMSYDLREWPQRFEGFIPYVTILDSLANVGNDAAACLGGRTLGWRDFMRGRSES